MPTSNFHQPHTRTVILEPEDPNPGPGAYRTNHGEDSRFGSIEISSTFAQPSCRWSSFTPSPGPTDYEDNSIDVLKERRPAYTMRIKPTQEITVGPVSISLGPAEYGRLTDPVPNIQTAPWKHPVSRKVDMVPTIQPGPGDYLSEHAKDTLAPRNPTYKLGLMTKSGGPVPYGAASPGPANYAVENYIGKGMAKSISAKDLVVSDRNVAKESTTPGPGAYLKHSSSAPVLNRAPEYTWGATNSAGRRSVNRIMGNKKVGPGKYDATDWHLTRNPSFTMPGRSKIKPWLKKEATPGPNFMPKNRPQKQYTMQGKNDYHVRTAEVYRNPGPGHYDDHQAWKQKHCEKTYDRPKGWTMGKRLSRKAALDSRKMGLTHDAPTGVASKSLKAPSYSMVGRHKQRQEAVMPGPGHYTIKPQMFNQQKIKRLC